MHIIYTLQILIENNQVYGSSNSITYVEKIIYMHIGRSKYVVNTFLFILYEMIANKHTA